MSYKLIQIINFNQLEFYKKQIVELIKLFIEKSKSKTTVDRTMDYIINLLLNPLFKLYIVIDGSYEPVAYYLIQLGVDDDTTKNQAFIYQHCSKVGLIKDVNEQLKSVLTAQGIEVLKFITKRDNKAFAKSLGDKWKEAGVVMEKDLKKEEK